MSDFPEDNQGGGFQTEKGDETKEGGEQVRILIENSQVGGIIGKGGANVTRVREESGVFLSILKAESPNVQERVMVMKGAFNQLIKGIEQIAELLVEADNRTKKLESDRENSTKIRLLVHRSTVGAVIGKAGVVIKETQNETGARVQVSNDHLPNSTEKTVSVTGTPHAIHQAATRILTQLKDNPLRPGTKSYPYSPGQAMFPPSPYGVPGNYPFYGQQPHSPIHPYVEHTPSIYGQPAALAQPPSTQKIAIPTVTAGCVIGKRGSVIRDLRTQSGCNISIADAESSNPNERVVTLTGSPQGIQTAIYLIRQLVEQYQPPTQGY